MGTSPHSPKLTVARSIPATPTSPSRPAHALTVCHAAEEGWVVALKERLREHDLQLLSELHELLSCYEEELLKLEDFQEFFDMTGVLPDVLSEASSCKEFVTNIRGH